MWRVYVIYGRNWIVCPPCVRTINACSTFIIPALTSNSSASKSFLFSLARLVRSHSLIPRTIKYLTYLTKACGIKTIVANSIFSSSSVFDPSILSWITSFFVLTIVTQISATTLIAGRIYAASQPFRISGGGEVEEAEKGDNNNVVGDKLKGSRRRNLKYEPTQREKYLATVWLVVESGFIYSSAAIVQLVTYLLQMNAGVIMEFMLSQLSVSVFFPLLGYSSFDLNFFSIDRQWFR